MSTRNHDSGRTPAGIVPVDEDHGAASTLIDAVVPGPEGRATSGVTADGRLKSGKLAGRTMWGAILALGWPILCESYLASLVGLTDTVLAAQISEAATDAIGGAAYILWFIGLVVQAIGVGATALVSRSVGGRRWAVAHAATSQALVLGIVSGVAVAGIIVAIAGPMASALNLRGEAAAGFVTYLRIVALSVPAIAVVSCGISCARGAGDSVRPLISMVVVNLVNMFGAFALSGVDLASTRLENGQVVRHVLLANGFSFKLGVAGIAWGTVIAQYVGGAIVMFILVYGKSGIQVKARWLKPHWVTIQRVMRLGFTNFLETAGMWVGNFLIVLMVGWMSRMPEAHGHGGGGLLGAHIVAARIEAFSYLPGFAIGIAAATLAGQYLGARSPDLARKAIVRCMLITTSITGPMSLCFLLFPKQIVGLISGQPTHLEIAPQLLWIAGLVQVPFGISNVLRAALRGAGDVRPMMWIIWVCTYGVRLPLAYALSGVDVPLPGGGVFYNPFRHSPSLPLVWVALCSEILVRAALCLARFLQGSWVHARV